LVLQKAALVLAISVHLARTAAAHILQSLWSPQLVLTSCPLETLWMSVVCDAVPIPSLRQHVLPWQQNLSKQPCLLVQNRCSDCRAGVLSISDLCRTSSDRVQHYATHHDAAYLYLLSSTALNESLVRSRLSKCRRL
jgi:hypothetical protein